MSARPACCVSVTTIVGMLITYLIPPDAKATLVFWRVRNPLPGCSAFSHHVHSDPRIDAAALKKKCGPFPSDPQEQNALWYKLYKKNETDARILDSQQMFLFFRDAASISLLIFVVIAVLCAVWRACIPAMWLRPCGDSHPIFVVHCRGP